MSQVSCNRNGLQTWMYALVGGLSLAGGIGGTALLRAHSNTRTLISKLPAIFGITMAVLVFVAWLLFKGPLGARIAGEEHGKQATCEECIARGPGWDYVMPSFINSDRGGQGFGLWLRKARCYLGGGSGSCLCVNREQQAKCFALSQLPGVPDGLYWWDSISNARDAKGSCSCCRGYDYERGSGKTDDCYDMSASDSLKARCDPFADSASAV